MITHLRSAASTVRGILALGEFSTAQLGSAAASCPANTAAHACVAAKAPAESCCNDRHVFWSSLSDDCNLLVRLIAAVENDGVLLLLTLWDL